jgi:inhibitor of KinA sporulation pathway (predicted exonuclease)
LKENAVARRLDKIVVVDIEATCSNDGTVDPKSSEIIEVGVCLLGVGTGERSDIEPRPFYVKPTSTVVTPFCTELTGITEEMVDRQGVPFAEACEVLNEACKTRQRVWASYGDYDRKIFERQCQREAVPYPFGKTHVNVKTLVALLAGARRETGMEKVLGRMGLPLEGRHHCGRDDAWNIAKILWTVIEKFR